MKFRTLIAIAAAGILSAAASAIDNIPLIQAKVMRDLQKAERMIDQGDYEKAAIYASLYSGDVLTVRVEKDSLPVGEEEEAMSALNSAMKMWEDESDGQVQFRLVESGPAMVRLRFTSNLYVGGCAAAGRCTWSRQVIDWGFGQATREMKARIDVRWLGTDGRNHSEAAMRHTIAHELGHVIGLDDNPGAGIMGALDPIRPQTGLSDPEEKALDTLLSASSGLSARALSFVVARR
jgi:predicted Zn-dependent protease with MMP-like domain